MKEIAGNAIVMGMTANAGPGAKTETGALPVKEPDCLATRASLLGRLKNVEDQVSWQDFFETYWRLIYGVARRAGLNDPEAQDVVQDTLLAVAKNIGQFRYDPARCSFKSWLLLITRQRIIWQWRNRAPAAMQAIPTAEDSTRTDLIERIPDPDGNHLDRVWDEEWQKNLLAAALEGVKQKSSPRQFQIFDLAVLQNWPADEVARTLRINRAQVYLAKHRVGALLKQELKRIEEHAPVT